MVFCAVKSLFLRDAFLPLTYTFGHLRSLHGDGLTLTRSGFQAMRVSSAHGRFKGVEQGRESTWLGEKEEEEQGRPTNRCDALGGWVAGHLSTGCHRSRFERYVIAI
jgi:hypothetical protein